jgi:hypothetical protein
VKQDAGLKFGGQACCLLIVRSIDPLKFDESFKDLVKHSQSFSGDDKQTSTPPTSQ